MVLTKKSTTQQIPEWIRVLYLYAVSVITMVVLIIGTIALLSLLIKNVAFGVYGNWYQSPENSCDEILRATSDDVYISVPPPASIGTTSLIAMSADQRQQYFDYCLEREAERIRQENLHRAADEYSWALAMILVGGPLFWLHWRMIGSKPKKK